VGQGFTWIPSYYIRVLDDKTVRMEMKALVENFAEPLVDVETDLVIGTPNLAFGMQLDPIINPGFDAQFDNAMRDMNFNAAQVSSLSSNSMRVRGGRESAADADMSAYFTQEFAAIGEKSFDLYHYKLGKITIPTQTKAYFPIFAEKVGYEEVYAATLPDHVSFINSRAVRRDEQKSDVHHSFKLKNTTGYPFTTASVVVEDKNSQFLAQDRILYTPQKSDALISISRAIDVDIKNTEEELSRDIDYKTIDKAVYGRAKIKGQIKLHNYQKKAIKVDVTKHLYGEATDAEGGGKIEIIPNQAVNQTSTIKWQIALAPDEGKTVEYEYEVLWQTK
ncbi:MAG TPA: hypothetical protein VFH43_10125, partial [Candidatus Kapabacteria bacterium]|nr:hypothetical protein [Candidatus Kapabacteria bacterium]